jgi:CDP-diacylglycerol---glycerol-3-phosphate 3-phosphatidyltransferase
MNVIPQSVKDGFVRAVGPLARALIRGRVSPNTLTTLGLLIIAGSAVAFAIGRVRLGGFLILFSGLFDILDGQVARQGGLMTKFGAFYDSTLDRVGESILFGGVALFFLHGGVPPDRETLAVALTIVALVTSQLVSYTRARAEGLGLDCQVGIAPRAERVFLLGAPSLVFGSGPEGRLLFWIIALLAVVTAITVVQRVLHVAELERRPRAPVSLTRRRDDFSGHAAVLRKVP